MVGDCRRCRRGWGVDIDIVGGCCRRRRGWVIVDVANAGVASILTWWIVVNIADVGGASTLTWWVVIDVAAAGGGQHRCGGSSSMLRTWVGRRRLLRGGGRRWAVGYEKRGAWSAVVTGSKWQEGLTWVCSGDVVVGKKKDRAG